MEQLGDTLTNKIKDAVAYSAIAVYTTGNTVLRDRTVVNIARDNIKKHISVEAEGGHLLISINQDGVAKEPPFHGVIVHAMADPRFKACCDAVLAVFPEFDGYDFAYLLE